MRLSFFYALLELKTEFRLVSVCTRSVLSESESKGWRTIIDPGSDKCEGNCQNWCDKFLALGLQSQCLAGGSETLRQQLLLSAVSPLLRPKQGEKGRTDAVSSTFPFVRGSWL